MKKLIESYTRQKTGKEIKLTVYAKSMEEAWTAITNIRATVNYARCWEWHKPDKYIIDGTIEGGLIQIEQLIKNGWTWV